MRSYKESSKLVTLSSYCRLHFQILTMSIAGVPDADPEQARLCTMVRRLRIPRRPDLSIRSLEDEESWFSDKELEAEEDIEPDP